jgi:hypothetical protein
MARSPGPRPSAGHWPTARKQADPVAAPADPSNGEADLLAAMEAMKPLVANRGADKVNRIVDLLG